MKLSIKEQKDKTYLGMRISKRKMSYLADHKGNHDRLEPLFAE